MKLILDIDVDSPAFGSDEQSAKLEVDRILKDARAAVVIMEWSVGSTIPLPDSSGESVALLYLKA